MDLGWKVSEHWVSSLLHIRGFIGNVSPSLDRLACTRLRWASRHPQLRHKNIFRDLPRPPLPPRETGGDRFHERRDRRREPAVGTLRLPRRLRAARRRHRLSLCTQLTHRQTTTICCNCSRPGQHSEPSCSPSSPKNGI